MLFHFLNLSQCVVCMFGNKTIYKVINLEVHSKRRYFSRTTANGSFGLQSCFPAFVTSQIFNLAYGNLNGWGTLGWALHVLKSKPMLLFLYHCISDGNQLFSENVGCHFHFILHLMSDKAAFVSRALFYVKRYRGKLELSRFNSASRIFCEVANSYEFIWPHSYELSKPKWRVGLGAGLGVGHSYKFIRNS